MISAILLAMGDSVDEVYQGAVWFVMFAVLCLVLALILIFANAVRRARLRRGEAHARADTYKISKQGATPAGISANAQDLLGPGVRLGTDNRVREEFLAHMRMQHHAQPKVDVVVPKQHRFVATDFRMSEYTYTKRDYLLTRTEREFFVQLYYMFKGKYLIFPQIHLTGLLNYRHGKQSAKGAWGSIRHYSVDYVVCAPDLSILCAIELDDRSHDRPDRRARDRAVNQLCRDAGLSLVRIAVGDMHDSLFVKKEINHAIAGSQ